MGYYQPSTGDIPVDNSFSSLTVTGVATLTGGVTLGATATLGWSGRAQATSPADGKLLLTDAAGTAWTQLQFGGTTASYPSIKRVTTALNFRKADDSADCNITAAGGTFSGEVDCVQLINSSNYYANSQIAVIGLGSINTIAWNNNNSGANGSFDVAIGKVATNTLRILGQDVTTGTVLNRTGGALDVPGIGAANSQQFKIDSASTLLSAMSGATVTATNLIPAGAMLLGLTTRVTTVITGATATLSVGDGTTANQFSNLTAIAAGTTTDNTNWLGTAPLLYKTATSVVVTATATPFTAGAMRITAHYLLPVAPAS